MIYIKYFYLTHTTVNVLVTFLFQTSSGHGTDLFALPSKYLNKTERIRVVEQHPVSPFLYVIATDYSLCLVDLRFPDNPVSIPQLFQ